MASKTPVIFGGSDRGLERDYKGVRAEVKELDGSGEVSALKL